MKIRIEIDPFTKSGKKVYEFIESLKDKNGVTYIDFNEEDYLRLKDSYILTPEKLVNAKADLSILHPLPRVNEISVAIDNDPRACYFKQVLYGKYMRMALILKLLEVE